MVAFESVAELMVHFVNFHCRLAYKIYDFSLADFELVYFFVLSVGFLVDSIELSVTQAYFEPAIFSEEQKQNGPNSMLIDLALFSKFLPFLVAVI